MSTSSINERRFGRDCVLPGLGQSVTPTLTGDWPTVAGEANLRGAAIRRIGTSPRAMTHRPEYGAGLVGQVEKPSTQITAARQTAAILDNMTRDPRIENVEVSVTEDPDAPERVLVDVTIYPLGDDQGVRASTGVASG